MISDEDLNQPASVGQISSWLVFAYGNNTNFQPVRIAATTVHYQPNAAKAEIKIIKSMESFMGRKKNVKLRIPITQKQD
jgi:hypothetical protein